MNYTVNRSYKIAFTKSSGFTYSIVSSKASVTTIVKPAGTVASNTNTINIVMYLNGLDAYNNNVITVTAIDTSTGCTITLTDNLTKLTPCNDLLISIDNPINTLTYRAVITNGKEPYTYKWIYNTNNFEAIGSITSDTLNLRNIIDVTPFNVSVEVTDANGCKKTQTVSYTSSCKPVIPNIIATSNCTTIEGVIYNKYTITLTNNGCGDLVQELIALDNSFIKSITSLSNNKYEIVIDRSFTSNFKQFYVKNNLGYKSNDFFVSLNPIDCLKPINCVATTANDNIITLGSTEKESNTKINVIGDDTDYDTFKFINTVPQTLISNTQLNTIRGIATYNPATREINHIFTSTGERNDVVIKWSIANKCGDTITKTLTIKTRVIDIPNVSGKQAKVIRGKSSSISIDGIDKLTIIKNPTAGNVSISSNTLTYNSSEIGIYNFELLPYNEGITGLPFTTSYEVVSAGSAINLDFCELGLINLQDYLSGASTGGNWYGVNNTIFISQSNQVDFSSLPIGTYQFQYVVTAGSNQDTATVTFNKYSFKLNAITVIPAQAGAFKVTIQHEGLLIENIRDSVYILNGATSTVDLDGESTATSFSFTVPTDTITNLTYSITTACGTLSKSYTKPAIQVSTFDIKGKGIATATLTKQPVSSISAANNIVGRGIFLTPVNLLLGNQVVCNNGMDVVFVLDYTSSMGGTINNIKSQITNIKNTIITESNSNYRLGLVIFDEDTTPPNYTSLTAYTSLPSAQKIVESGTSAGNGSTVYQYITAMESMSINNGDSFTTQLNKLNTFNLPLGSGLSIPEPSDKALYHVSKTVNPITGSFRNDVAKLIILITDAVPSGNNDNNSSDDLDYINNTLTPLFTANNLKLLLLSTSQQTQLMNLVTASNGVYVNSFNSATIISTIENICI
jgi:hypothetical protein